MKFLDAISFRYQMLLGFLMVALIPLLIFTFFMTKIYSVTFQHEMTSEGNNQIVMLDDKLSDFYQSAYDTCDYLCQEDISALALINKGEDDYQKKLYLMLYQERTTIPMDIIVSIYDAGGFLRFSTKQDQAESHLPVYWGIIQEARNDRNTLFHISDSIIDTESSILFRTCYTVKNKVDARMGYIIMELQKSDFDVLFSGCYNSSDTVFVTDEHFNLVYSSNVKYSQQAVNEFCNNSMSQKRGYFWCHNKQTGYYILLQKSSAISQEMNHTMFRIGLILSLFSLLLCILLANFLGKQLSEPIRQLNKGMDMVKKGNLSIHVETKQTNELGELTSNFNHMTEELDMHVKNMVQRQKDIKDMQIKLFQTQLNPHFLYNTLDSIKWTARIHLLDDISAMAENLAFVLQESLRNEQFITLKKELEILDYYIKIQQIRFEDKFTYEVEIPDDLEECIVPKLMLQPIVENSIIHGLAEKEENDGSISIYADQVGEEIHIFVTDNGIGIPDSLIDWLNNADFMKKEGHLGLYNVNKIIKLYFGTEYGLHATVEDGIGTTITICLPIKRGKVND